MSTNAILIELLISGFFAIACFKARAGDISSVATRPKDFLRLTDRPERLRRSRWQWCAMVAILIVVRMQSGLPLVIELTAALQFVVFLALPTCKGSEGTKSAPRVRRGLLASLAAKQVSRGKA
jgi:hypothetical protein